MNFTSFWLLSFIALLCSLPWLVKWLQRRTGRGLGALENTTKLVSVLAVGPQQRVMT
jgi:flagellar protein FliO/FliZ